MVQSSWRSLNLGGRICAFCQSQEILNCFCPKSSLPTVTPTEMCPPDSHRSLCWVYFPSRVFLSSSDLTISVVLFFSCSCVLSLACSYLPLKPLVNFTFQSVLPIFLQFLGNPEAAVFNPCSRSTSWSGLFQGVSAASPHPSWATALFPCAQGAPWLTLDG